MAALEDDRLKNEGDSTVGDEGDPGPAGSSTGVRAPHGETPRGAPHREPNEDARKRRRGLRGKDSVGGIDDVAESGMPAGSEANRINRG